MDQVSLPYRIALVALLVVAALWFVALRPKGETEQSTADAPGVTGLANDVDKAREAASASQSSADATQRAAGEASGGSATSTGGASASKSGNAGARDLLAGVQANDPSRTLLEAVDKGRVAVVLFWNPRGSDDHAVRRAVLHLNRRHGKVVTRVTSIANVGRYEAITRGIEIQGSPTVVVINRKGVARTIAGYTTTPEISQLVSDLGGKGF